jgi:hypothetical protein
MKLKTIKLGMFATMGDAIMFFVTMVIIWAVFGLLAWKLGVM